MSLKYQKIGITVRSDITEREKVLVFVTEIIEKAGATVLLDPDRSIIPVLKDRKTFTSCVDIDLLLVIGGDGTILRSIREIDDLTTPILSINKGTVGFLSELTVSQAEELIPYFLQGKGIIEERSMLCVSAMRGKTVLWTGKVLNEAVVSQGAISRLIDLQTRVNGEPLTTFHSDGLIIATPTGSTAYSLAAGGPIVHPELQATILTPINPHSFSQKPLILPAEHAIDVTILTKQNKFSDIQVSLTLDGQTYVTLQGNDVVHVEKTSDTAKFLRRNDETYFTTIRSKLKWGERIEDGMGTNE